MLHRNSRKSFPCDRSISLYPFRSRYEPTKYSPAASSAASNVSPSTSSIAPSTWYVSPWLHCCVLRVPEQPGLAKANDGSKSIRGTRRPRS
eukprot:2069907-Rhodomonas_salina.2